MVAQQRIKVANEKASKNITQRGNVPKSTVSNVQGPIWNNILAIYYQFSYTAVTKSEKVSK